MVMNSGPLSYSTAVIYYEVDACKTLFFTFALPCPHLYRYTSLDLQSVAGLQSFDSPCASPRPALVHAELAGRTRVSSSERSVYQREFAAWSGIDEKCDVFCVYIYTVLYVCDHITESASCLSATNARRNADTDRRARVFSRNSSIIHQAHVTAFYMAA